MSTTIGGSSHRLRFSHAMKGLKIISHNYSIMSHFEREDNHNDAPICRYEDDELWAMKIKGSAFLWHQIRCMVAVLFLIGQGLESSNVRGPFCVGLSQIMLMLAKISSMSNLYESSLNLHQVLHHFKRKLYSTFR